MREIFSFFILLVTFFSFSLPQALANDPIDIVFPVDGPTTFTDDFNDARSGGRTHNAIDIIADKMTPILSATDGVVRFAPTSEPSYGFMLSISGNDGYTYTYIHINNDTPGTDDGEGGVEYAYAPGIREGVRVERGEHIAWVGDSGNAETVGAHLHFEIYDGDTPINPYPFLIAAQEDTDFSPEAETTNATSINTNQNIPLATEHTACTSDSLIRTEEFSTVYYCGQDGGRYAFQNKATFFSWYENFDDVETITKETMSEIPLRGVVTFKPGTTLVKLLSVPKVYAVAANGTLRWITTANLAEELYGQNWATSVKDLPESLYSAYTLGENILR